MEPPPPSPFTLVHGDLRSDNIFFSQPLQEGPSPSPVIIDWQTTGIGQPMTDITRWLTQSITIETRQAHEQTLLKIYHERLVERGVSNYSFKQMCQEYRLNLIVTLLMFSMSMDEIDQSSERADALFHAMYSRLDSALADWRAEKTLKILPLKPLLSGAGQSPMNSKAIYLAMPLCLFLMMMQAWLTHYLVMSL